MTSAEIDAQYNPSIGLADPGQPLAHYQAQAEAACARLPHRLGIPYGPTPAQTLDIFPADRPGAPVFVFLHGGYWRSLAARDFSGVALGPHARGITTVVVDYALCPEVDVDEIVRQARAALAWVRRHIASHGGNPARVAIGGHSAGAQLAAMCLLADGEALGETHPVAAASGAAQVPPPPVPLRAALLVSGIYELEPIRHSYLQPVLQLDEGLVQRNSPLRGLQAGAGRRASATPVWLTWGEVETSEFARQSLAFHEAWRALGNASHCASQAGADHFSAIHGFEHPGSPLCEWLARQLAD